MTSVLILSNPPDAAAALSADLTGVGLHVLGSVGPADLAREALSRTPDVVIADEPVPDAALFDAIEALDRAAPVPILLFCESLEPEEIERAIHSGVHGCIIDGYDPQRIRSLILVAQARFRREQALRAALADVTHRFEERKLVDRAKGILMRATQLPEEEAFRILRNASMQSNQRVGQVSRQVIDAARYAESVNLAGQLRMLSQRLVKLYALIVDGTGQADAQPLLRQSIERVDANLGRLPTLVSTAGFGDLIGQVSSTWATLAPLLRRPPGLAELADVDQTAEQLLDQAEQLTRSLALGGIHAPLQVINTAGRQRMLSQRLAKQALLNWLLPADASDPVRDAIAATISEFETALDYLAYIPLTTPDIGQALARARDDWQAMRSAIDDIDRPVRRLALAGLSEQLLTHFDYLTDRYERSMQILTGWRPQASMPTIKRRSRRLRAGDAASPRGDAPAADGGSRDD